MKQSSATTSFMMQQASAEQRRRWLHPLIKFLAKGLFHINVRGIENIPSSGPTVLMMNHMTFIDPVIATVSVKNRHVIAMAKAETMDQWFFRFVVNLWGNFTVRRGEIDRQAIQNAIALLQHNQLLLIAPEGTRNPNTGLQAPKDGLSYIIHKADAVIVPTAVVGAHDWQQRLKRFQRMHATLCFGKPFRFLLPDGLRLDRYTRHDMMWEAMYQLASVIPDEFRDKRGIFSDLSQATTQYLNFLDQDNAIQQPSRS